MSSGGLGMIGGRGHGTTSRCRWDEADAPRRERGARTRVGIRPRCIRRRGRRRRLRRPVLYPNRLRTCQRFFDRFVLESEVLMAVSDALVREFRTRVDWPVWMLRDRLNAAKGDVDKALLGVVDTGLDPMRLNARVVPGELFVRAKTLMLRNHLNNARTFLAHFRGKPDEAEWRETVASLE